MPGDGQGDRYLGHNIACIAVDENGSILDFDFNHNELFNSSAEHAEASLVRRLFSLNQSYNDWQTVDPAQAAFVKYGNALNGVTVYTSLESCAQCSGVMTLAACRRVVYLQTDPGQYRVGNILYNLSRPARVKADPASRYVFASPRGTKDTSTGITSFLCTDLTRDIFARAASHLGSLELAFPDHRPPRSDGETIGVRSNAEMLKHAMAFVPHALVEARRGTPHH